MSLASAADELVESIVEFPALFREVANHDPLNVVFLLFGALFVGAAVAVLAYLSLGALVSLFTGDWASRPPRDAR